MVSERIWGETDIPAREVTDVSKLRPGDIILKFDKNGQIYHTGIVKIVAKNPDRGNIWLYSTYNGNIGNDSNGAYGYVTWADRNQYPFGTLEKMPSGVTARAFTRYPESESEIKSEIP